MSRAQVSNACPTVGTPQTQPLWSQAIAPMKVYGTRFGYSHLSSYARLAGVLHHRHGFIDASRHVLTTAHFKWAKQGDNAWASQAIERNGKW